MYKICDNIIVTDLNGDIIVSRRNDPKGNNIIVFNNIAQEIIRHIREKHTIEMIIDDLHTKTAVSSDTIRRDLSDFINQLIAAGIIEVYP